MPYTTLNKMRACAPCAESWAKYLRHVGKTQPDDEPISILEVLEVLGFEDAVWSLRGFQGVDEVAVRLYATFCARQLWTQLQDERSRNSVVVAERYAAGTASREQLIAAWSSAVEVPYSEVAEVAEACTRLDVFDAAWSAYRLAAVLSPVDVLEQEFRRVFCVLP